MRRLSKGHTHLLADGGVPSEHVGVFEHGLVRGGVSRDLQDTPAATLLLSS